MFWWVRGFFLPPPQEKLQDHHRAPHTCWRVWQQEAPAAERGFHQIDPLRSVMAAVALSESRTPMWPKTLQWFQRPAVKHQICISVFSYIFRLRTVVADTKHHLLELPHTLVYDCIGVQNAFGSSCVFDTGLSMNAAEQTQPAPVVSCLLFRAWWASCLMVGHSDAWGRLSGDDAVERWKGHWADDEATDTVRVQLADLTLASLGLE